MTFEKLNEIHLRACGVLTGYQYDSERLSELQFVLQKRLPLPEWSDPLPQPCFPLLLCFVVLMGQFVGGCTNLSLRE